MEVTELLNRLESNQPQIVEETKKILHESFNATKESWLVVGLFDYYIYTSSVRSIDILVGVREPHDKHLFDKILDALKGSSKLQALTLLGHVVRRQPTWLYKITQHPLMKELIKVLKTEIDIMPLMSALLVLIVLLPMIPALIGPFLPDIFEVFSRLAAWKCTNVNKLPEGHLLQLQVTLYALFHRLYGMYPCNFLSYMRTEYSRHENLGTFSHTIKPMLDSVKMHPLLVTHSKEGETTAQRWKSMEHHDVILECAKFSLDTEHSTLRSRPALETYHLPALDGFHNLAITAQSPASVTAENEVLWSPSVHCGFMTPPPAQESAATPIPQTPNAHVGSASLPHQEGTSPPEAAIEATPETTPIKDLRNVMGRPTPPINSSVVRALNTFSSAKWPGVTSNSTTPSQSQPSSPMRKEPAPTFPSETTTPTSAFELPRRESLFAAADPRRDFLIAQKVQKVLHERNQVAVESPPIEKLAMNLRPRSSGVPPTSPLRVIGSTALCVPNSPVPMDPTAPVPGGNVSRPTPEKNGFRFDIAGHDSTQEDREVFEIVRQGEQLLMESQPRPVPVVSSASRHCDSVLHDIHGPHTDDYEECPQDSGSPCTSGGLHMPNSRSMLVLARRVALQQRQRYYSQCVPDHPASTLAETASAGSSPGDGAAFAHVRRANSCPEMKKIPALPAAEIVKGKVLLEREELDMEEPAREWHALTNGKGAARSKATKGTATGVVKETATAGTQTVEHWTPFPYEHLFLEVLPSVEQGANCEGRVMPYTVPSPAPLEGPHRESPYAMLDKYIDTVAQPSHDARRTKGHASAEAEGRVLREQIFLLNIQLQFERHRREVHAERNRRLLGKSRSTRAMEEHNMALREQLSLLQADIEQLHIETDKKKREFNAKENKFQENIVFWQNQCNALTIEVKDLNMNRKVLELEVKTAKEKTATVEKDCQRVEKELFDALNDMRHAMSGATAGARLRGDVERLQKELLLMGELQQRLREHASQRPLLPRHDEDELVLVRDCGKAEITALSELLTNKSGTLEASRARLVELESVLTRKDLLIADQKRTLKLVKEEYHDQLEAVESKFETQRAINQRMEEQVMFLTNQLEELERGRIARSPDSSAHEASVSVSSAGSANRLLGLSPPLAESLRDRPQVWPTDTVGMRSLQLIAEQPEQRKLYDSAAFSEPGTSGDG